MTDRDSREAPNPRAASLNNRANAILRRAGEPADEDALDSALPLYRKALDLATPDWVGWARLHANYGTALVQAANLDGDVALAHEACRILEEAFRGGVPESLAKHLRFNLVAARAAAYRLQPNGENLGSLADEQLGYIRNADVGDADMPRMADEAYRHSEILFETTGELRHLDRAIEILRTQLAAAAATSAETSELAAQLGSDLRLRYEHSGRRADAVEGLALLEAEHQGLNADASHYAGVTGNLANLLLSMFLEDGDASKLDRAIDLYEEAKSLEDDAEGRATHMSNIGNALMERFRLRGQFDDVNRAEREFRASRALVPQGSAMASKVANNLGTTLLDRFRFTNEWEAVDEAIEIFEGLREGEGADHRFEVGVLNNLATSYQARFHAIRDVADLDQAAEALQEIIRETPEGAPQLPGYQSNLGVVLRKRYVASGELEDLAGAIEAHELAVALTPEDSPYWPERTSNLANVLRHRFDATGNPEDRERASNLQSRVIDHHGSRNPEAACRAARNWGEWAFQNRRWGEAVEAFTRGFTMIDALTAAQTDRLGGEVWTRFNQQASGMAAYAAARDGDVAAAVAFLERGQARLLSDALELPGPDLAESAATLEGIQQRLGAASDVGALAYLCATDQGTLGLVATADSAEAFFSPCSDADLLDILFVEEADGTPRGGYLYGQLLNSKWTRRALEDGMDPVAHGVCSPLAEALRGREGEHVAVVPVGRLSLFPMHALPLAPGENECLLDQYVLSFAPNARVLFHSLANASSDREGALAFFGVANSNPLDRPLWASQAEVEEAATHFDSTSVLCGLEARKEEVVQTLPTAKWLHLAVHGQFRHDKPLESNLELSSGELLLAQEVLDLPTPLAARLVVLSACQAAMTEFHLMPDEMIGLPSAIIEAGAAGVVAPLWKVDDVATAVLMGRFYECLLDPSRPASPAGALREAQLWMRDADPDTMRERAERVERAAEAVDRGPAQGAANRESNRGFDHPYYWAGFVHVGA